MVLGTDRLLEPQDVVLLQQAAELDGVGHREAVVGVDRELHVRPDRLAHRTDSFGIELEIAQTDLHLDGAEAVILEFQRLLDGFLDQAIHVDEVEAGGVGNDFAAIGAADQFVNGLVHRAAHDVPQRDIDAGDGRDRHAGRAVILDAIVEVLPDRLDVERIAADHARLVLRLDEGLGDRGRSVAFAPAGDALVRRDLDQACRARAIDPTARRDERLVDLALQDVAGDVGDLHNILLIASAPHYVPRHSPPSAESKFCTELTRYRPSPTRTRSNAANGLAQANHGWIPRRSAKNEIEIPPPHGATSLAPDAASGQPIAVDGDLTEICWIGGPWLNGSDEAAIGRHFLRDLAPMGRAKLHKIARRRNS